MRTWELNPLVPVHSSLLLTSPWLVCVVLILFPILHVPLLSVSLTLTLFFKGNLVTFNQRINVWRKTLDLFELHTCITVGKISSDAPTWIFSIYACHMLGPPKSFSFSASQQFCWGSSLMERTAVVQTALLWVQHCEPLQNITASSISLPLSKSSSSSRPLTLFLVISSVWRTVWCNLSAAALTKGDSLISNREPRSKYSFSNYQAFSDTWQMSKSFFFFCCTS